MTRPLTRALLWTATAVVLVLLLGGCTWWNIQSNPHTDPSVCLNDPTPEGWCLISDESYPTVQPSTPPITYPTITP